MGVLNPFTLALLFVGVWVLEEACEIAVEAWEWLTHVGGRHERLGLKPGCYRCQSYHRRKYGRPLKRT
jgi:hypothetical protein